MEVSWRAQLAIAVFWCFLSALTGGLRVAAPDDVARGLRLKQGEKSERLWRFASLLSFGKFKAGRNPIGIFRQPACLPCAYLLFPSLP